MGEAIEKQKATEPKSGEKNWSWIMFFLIGGFFNHRVINAGLVAIVAYFAMLFLAPSVFYKITREIKRPESKYVKSAMIGFALLVLTAFILGAAGAIDLMLI